MTTGDQTIVYLCPRSGGAAVASYGRTQRISGRSLRRDIRRRLHSLRLPAPLTMPVLCERLGEQRGRPLHFEQTELPVPGPFGLWIATDDADRIYVQSATTPAHQLLISLHEIGHVLAGHSGELTEPSAQPAEEPTDDVLHHLVPDLPAWMIRSELHRATYDEDEERQAELVGSIILEWADRIEMTAPASPTDEGARRAQDALGLRQGWL